MTLATVGKRCQVVIPRKERKLLSLKPHTKVNVMVEGGRLVVQPCEGCDWRGIGKDLRARYGMPLPDMLQAACALESAMPALVTNDKDLRKVREVDVFLLCDFR